MTDENPEYIKIDPEINNTNEHSHPNIIEIEKNIKIENSIILPEKQENSKIEEIHQQITIEPKEEHKILETPIDPVLKKENEEIKILLNKKLNEIDSFLNREWNVYEEKDTFKSFYLDEKSGFRRIKSQIVIKRNMLDIAQFLDDLNKRNIFDKNFDHGKILRDVDEFHSIRYLKFKGKIFISPRDFIIIGRREIVRILNKYFLAT